MKSDHLKFCTISRTNPHPIGCTYLSQEKQKNTKITFPWIGRQNWCFPKNKVLSNLKFKIGDDLYRTGNRMRTKSYADSYVHPQRKLIFAFNPPLTFIFCASFCPIVLRYSEVLIEGTARAVQYCVGQNMNLGWQRCWKILTGVGYKSWMCVWPGTSSKREDRDYIVSLLWSEVYNSNMAGAGEQIMENLSTGSEGFFGPLA
jgi:hypothetical protein